MSETGQVVYRVIWGLLEYEKNVETVIDVTFFREQMVYFYVEITSPLLYATVGL